METVVESVEATLVLVPMRRTLGTSVASVANAPLLLIDLRTSDGVTGRAYLFCYLEAAGHAQLALVRDVNAVLKGVPAAPAELRRVLEARFKLLGARGLVSAVRAAVGPDVAVMSDYNQRLSLVEARDRCRALDDEGLYWIEEPVRHDDYAANAELAALLRTPVQIGENFAGPREMARALRHGACDLVMPDLDRIGGVSGWQAAAALADAAEVPVSSHLYPEVCAHLLAATPTAHWLEYVDWANPILREPLPVVDGHAAAPDRPGNGLAWDADAVARYRVG
jgi:hypothetical protein